jgi:hypothetical protein
MDYLYPGKYNPQIKNELQNNLQYLFVVIHILKVVFDKKITSYTWIPISKSELNAPCCGLYKRQDQELEIIEIGKKRLILGKVGALINYGAYTTLS